MLATVLIFIVLLVAAEITVGPTRDALIGATVGGFVTLVATVGAQEMRARAERREREEARAREEMGILSALARELFEACDYLVTATEGDSVGEWRLLPDSSWKAMHVRLGEFWHPHEVAALSVQYLQMARANELMRALGAPADGTSLYPPKGPPTPETVTFVRGLSEGLRIAVVRLNQRADVLAKRYGWPERPGSDPGYDAPV